MTKEEIQKNSEHWYNKYKDVKKRIKELEKENETLSQNLDDAMSVENCLKKRITDLEVQNKWLEGCKLELGEHLGKANDKIADLEKENAELKEYNKYLKRKRQGGIQKQYNKVAIIKQQDEQLTKAKDHIKKLLDCLKQDTNDPETNYYVCQYMDEAEQFLNSEVENDSKSRM